MSEVSVVEDALQNKFLAWQCLLRQYCVRQYGGQPLPGMCPELTIEGLDTTATLNVVLVKKEPRNITAQFRHMLQKTVDPNERYDNAIQLLSSAYYQHHAEFSDRLTALFGLESTWVNRLVAAPYCTLKFTQANQSYRLVCTVEELPGSDEMFQATYWHNHLFNPTLPGSVRVVAFRPDWGLSKDESEG